MWKNKKMGFFYEAHGDFDECNIQIVETIPDGVFTQEELKQDHFPIHEVIWGMPINIFKAIITFDAHYSI
jgi:hypothetical protein